MASSLQPHPACNAPTGMTKGKLSMTELQRQALGNMANKRTTNTQLDTKVNIIDTFVTKRCFPEN